MIGQSFAVVLLAGAVATAVPAQQDVDRAVRAFAERPAREQKKVLHQVRGAVDRIDHPYLRSVRGFAERARAKVKARLQFRHRKTKVERPGGDEVLLVNLPFPVANQYVFGAGLLVPFDPGAGDRSRKNKAASKLAFPHEAPPEAQLRAMLEGYPPDLDLALAAVLRDLDNDRGADAFSAFLESWRNGNESFYRALDRTAGTEEGVFFFDACLEEYIKGFVPRKHPDYPAIRRSYRDAHDALHAGFLVYRQYRALREAVALALLLPPEVPLPWILERYEKEAQYNEHSTREMVSLLLRLSDQDIGKVVAIVTTTAVPLPEHLWTAKYDPFPPLQKVMTERLPEMIELAGHSRKLLEEQHRIRSEVRVVVARAARDALAQSGIAVEASAKSGR